MMFLLMRLFMKKIDSEEIIDTKRYRNFMILFYRESKHYDFDDLIFNIHSLKYYAYIEHQPETDEKQPHFHAFIHLDTACTEQALSKRLGIPVDKIQYVKNVRGGCRYLTHVDYPDKIQYDISSVRVSSLFQRKFLKNFEDIKTEDQIIQDIYWWIDNWHYDDYFQKLKDFILYINLHCYDTIYKRYRPEIIDYLKQNL